jgi:Zn-dependent M16 (insulinase) family peptidase
MMTAESDKLDSLVSEFEQVWTPKSVDASFNAFSLDNKHHPVKQMWVANTQVNFCAKAYSTVPMEHKDAAALAVLGGFLRNGYLHTSIRERGGAYGGGASHDSNIAAFKFYSYRDPRLTETLEDFDRSIDWMLNNKHEWRQLEEAILGVIGAMDKPGSPSGEARHDFHNNLHGRTREKLQAARQRVLAVTIDDLKHVTETYLQPDKASTAVITSAATHGQLGDLGLEVINL